MKMITTLKLVLLISMFTASFCLIREVKQEIQAPISNATASVEERSSKFLSLFSIVRFANAACTATNSYNGTCFTAAECTNYGGTSSGTCASGFGVCCVVTITTCGQTTALNSTYWQNPGYSSTYSTAGQCTLYVSKYNSNICNLRLDFIAFSIASPDSSAQSTAGRCLTDVFTVSGQSNPVPSICGSNANQHIYLDSSPGVSTFSLNMILTGTTTSRTWNIRISQIPCGTSYTAPDNCLQYFMTATGTIMSFNFLFAATPVVQHLAYQDYTICIRTNQGFCGVSYAVCSSVNSEPAFAISGAATGIATIATSLADAECNTDWLQFPCASDQSNSALLSTSVAAPTGPVLGCVAKICGAIFSALTGASSSVTVYDYTKPFILYFHTDLNEYANTAIATSAESFGFCLAYTQQACTTTTG